MYYYDQNDQKPRKWAFVAALAYALVLLVSFLFVDFSTRPKDLQTNDTILVEFVPQQQSRPAPSRGDRVKAPTHEKAVSNEGTPTPEQKETGVERKEETRTPNPKALFNMSKSGKDIPADVGKQNAPEGEEQSAGKGKGNRGEGIEGLDHGLQGRGLIGSLPRPDYPGNKSGKVRIRVTVGADGTVTSAAFEQRGSTVNDGALIDAAITAARKARFTASEAAIQTGVITYVFRME